MSHSIWCLHVRKTTLMSEVHLFSRLMKLYTLFKSRERDGTFSSGITNEDQNKNVNHWRTSVLYPKAKLYEHHLSLQTKSATDTFHFKATLYAENLIGPAQYEPYYLIFKSNTLLTTIPDMYACVYASVWVYQLWPYWNYIPKRKEGNSCLIMGYVVFNNHVFHSVSVRVRVWAHIMKCKLKNQQQKVSH